MLRFSLSIKNIWLGFEKHRVLAKKVLVLVATNTPEDELRSPSKKQKKTLQTWLDTSRLTVKNVSVLLQQTWLVMIPKTP